MEIEMKKNMNLKRNEMFIAKVIGTVVATVKDKTLEGVKLLVVQPLNDDMSPRGKPIVAMDGIRVSGYGDLVYLAGKREAAIVFPEVPPVDAAITGFVDEYYVIGKAHVKQRGE